MRFIDTDFPMILSIREGHFDERELEQMSAAFEGYFERGERYASLSVADVSAMPIDARTRSQLASWANQPRVRHFSKLLCVGSATVTARPWERRALTALQWFWTPVAPHRAVSTVSDGLAFCTAQLVAAGVVLPSDAVSFEANLMRRLCALPIAGLPARGVALDGEIDVRTTRAEGLELKTLADADGSVTVGWVGASILWARIRGHLSVDLATSYAAELEQRLLAAREVKYFLDCGSLDSYDLAARTIGLGVIASCRGRLSSILALNWSANVSDVGLAIVTKLGGLMQATTSRVEFEAMLLEAAPLAKGVIYSQSEWPNVKNSVGQS